MDNRDHELFKDSNKMAMEYAKSAIQFAFLLNGAAATALFAKAQNSFVQPAVIFAIGAACAAVCMGLSYVTQLLITETWRTGGHVHTFSIVGRALSILFWLSSMIFFAYAAHETYYAV